MDYKYLTNYGNAVYSMNTIIETDTFRTRAGKIWTTGQYEDFVVYIANNPREAVVKRSERRLGKAKAPAAVFYKQTKQGSGVYTPVNEHFLLPFVKNSHRRF